MSQKDKVLQHLIDYGSISSMEAFEDYRITRVGAIIFNFRHKDKLNILTEPVKYLTADGKSKTGWIYKLLKGVATPSLSAGV